MYRRHRRHRRCDSKIFLINMVAFIFFTIERIRRNNAKETKMGNVIDSRSNKKHMYHLVLFFIVLSAIMN
jgi:hypothetical protein